MRKEAFYTRLPFIILFIAIVVAFIATVFVSNTMKTEIIAEPSNIEETIYDDYPILPVMKENYYIGYPYVDAGVSIGKKYYDFQGEEKNQEEALIVQENKYYQNTGIDYVKEDVFDVVSVMDGTVTMVKEDDLVGKTIQIEHKNGLISIYQSLGEIKVQKGEPVSQGQMIGKSGINEMDKELGNHLHFEIYENGNAMNPDLYINKEYKKEN